MINRLGIAIATFSLALLPPATAAVAAEPGPALAPTGKYYSSCDRLHRDFRYGVARSERAARKHVRDGYHKTAYSPRAMNLYRTNHSRLDADDDGTACEA